MLDDIIDTGTYKIEEQKYQPASLDLSLGETAYSLQCSFLPYGSSVESKLRRVQIDDIDIRRGAVLEKGRPYLIPLLEELKLPVGIHARTNPKSSTGRLDIFTRVITDGGHLFDEIPDGYHGRMFLEVFSRTFPIKVNSLLSLNQLRLFKGEPKCKPGELRKFHETKKSIVIQKDGQLGNLTGPNEDNTLGLSIDLVGTSGQIGFKAKKNSALLDLSRTNYYDPGEYWEPVFAQKNRPFILEPEDFYLLSSTEKVSIPPKYAAEMIAYETSQRRTPHPLCRLLRSWVRVG